MDDEAAIPIPDDIPDPAFDENTLAILARDMAWKVLSPASILQTHGITQAQYDKWIFPNGFYKRAYETYIIEWEAANSVNKRISVKSSALLEASLKPLGARLLDKKENLNHVIEGTKLLAKIAGADGEKKLPNDGEKFVININLGTKQLRYEETLGETIEPSAIRQIPEGKSAAPPLQSLIEGPHKEQ